MFEYLKRLYHKFGSPKYFYDITGKMLPWLVALSVLLLIPGLIYGLGFAPPEKYQGNSYRVIYIHVPAASIAMSGYMLMAVAGVVVGRVLRSVPRTGSSDRLPVALLD